MSENLAQFEQRKKDHIRIALDPQSQARGLTGLDNVRLTHEALPELNFSEIQISTSFLDQTLNSPIFISSMTAGHKDALHLNLSLARAAEARGWAMGVGSQRKELMLEEASREWKQVRAEAPLAVLFGNLGLAQVIRSPVSEIQRLIDNLGASALFVHLNSLQEVLQKEGTPDFHGGLAALENLCAVLEIPVIVKEVGCGFSKATLQRLCGTGVYAVDVAGLGGTHWGRVEGLRSEESDILFEAAKTFKDWGIPTVESVLSAVECKPDYKIWASGGVRSGLDVAKLIALGAEKVGIAQGLLEAALKGEKELDKVMQRLEYELKIALFCTGCQDLRTLSTKRVWTWN
jgi:isopentenyl-diphosphate delta-isomerase